MSKKGRDSARRIREMQAAQEAAEKRRLALIVGAAVLLLIAAVVVGGIVIQSQRSDDLSGATAPAGVVDKYGIERGQSAAPVTVTVYEDFQCPFCKEFEAALGATLTKDVDSGQIKVLYRPIAFLDDSSTTDYSSRALETAACTLNSAGPKKFVALHALLFEKQPAEGSAGLSDAELAALAGQAGANKGVVGRCQKDNTFADWVKAATDQGSKDGVNSTPTYLVDGKTVSFTDAATAPQVLQSAIDSAAGG